MAAHNARKGHVIREYKDTVIERVDIADAASGNNNLDSTVVPAGEIHVIHTASVKNATNIPTGLEIFAIKSSVGAPLAWKISPASGEHFIWVGEAILKEGDNIRGVVVGATLNDNLIFTLQGYKFDAP